MSPLNTDVVRRNSDADKSKDLLTIEQEYANQLQFLIGCTIEALEFYDSDDGHNQMVLWGLAARYRELEGRHEQDVAAAAERQARRKKR